MNPIWKPTLSGLLDGLALIIVFAAAAACVGLFWCALFFTGPPWNLIAWTGVAVLAVWWAVARVEKRAL